jgi:predicted Zn-dependent protease
MNARTLIAPFVMAAVFALEVLGIPARVSPASDWDASSRRADKLIAARRFADALPIALDIQRQHPDDSGAFRRLARVYAGLGRPADEAVAWERLLAVAPATQDVCVRLSTVYQRLDRPVNVVSTAERCLAFDPEQPELRADLAAAHAALGEGETQ